MATLVTRSGKGSPLTHAEVDANFTNLNTDKLELSGGTMTGNLSFGDNDKAIFGAGSDLQIYHDGSNSYMLEGGTGSLIVGGTNLYLANGDNSKAFLRGTNNADVALYYNNNIKLTTTSTGIDVTGNATFADNGKAIFGAGSDLQIYHDGSNSNISDVGTGSLILKASAGTYIRTANGENGVTVLEDGAVTLYYDNATKLATTSTGIDVTGTVTADGLTVDTNTLHVDATNNRVGINTASPTQTLQIGDIGGKTFVVDQSTSNITRLANDRSTILEAGGGYDLKLRSDGTSSFGNIVFETAGTTDRMKIASNGDISFYDSAGSSQSLFWDASAESLGIGTSSPSTTLDVAGTVTVLSGSNGRINIGASNNYLYGDSSNNFIIGTAGSDKFQITSSGNVGIGTTSPNSILELRGDTTSSWSTTPTIIMSSTSTANANIRNWRIGPADTVYGNFHIGVSDTQGGIVDTTAEAQAFTISYDGNVGIGVTPAVKLDVQSSSGIIGRIQSTSGDAQFNIAVPNANDGILAFGDASNYRASIKANTSDALTFQTGSSLTERMRIDSSGNLLVGTTTADQANNSTAANAGIALRPEGSGALQVSRDGGQPATFNRLTSDGNIAVFRKDGSTVGSILATSGDLGIGTGDTGVRFSDSTDSIYPIASTTGFSRDAAVDIGYSTVRFKDLYLSGDTFVGEPSTIGAGEAGVTVRGLGQIRVGRAGTASVTLVSFNNANGEVGTIVTSGSATAYNTSSDYRLKTDAQPMTGATDRIKQLNPVNFEWIADGTRVDGFLAHEAQAVVPEAVTGAKDAMRDEEYEVTPAVTDDDGNVVTEAVMGIRSVPDYQGIDQSKLVPLLVATIKELEARITALEAN